MRVQEALNIATANILLTAAELQVIYVNKTARGMFSAAVNDFRSKISTFDSLSPAGLNASTCYGDVSMRPLPVD